MSNIRRTNPGGDGPKKFVWKCMQDECVVRLKRVRSEDREVVSTKRHRTGSRRSRPLRFSRVQDTRPSLQTQRSCEGARCVTLPHDVKTDLRSIDMEDELSVSKECIKDLQRRLDIVAQDKIRAEGTIERRGFRIGGLREWKDTLQKSLEIVTQGKVQAEETVKTQYFRISNLEKELEETVKEKEKSVKRNSIIASKNEAEIDELGRERDKAIAEVGRLGKKITKLQRDFSILFEFAENINIEKAKLATGNAELTRQFEVARAEAEKQVKALRRELEARTQEKAQFEVHIGKLEEYAENEREKLKWNFDNAFELASEQKEFIEEQRESIEKLKAEKEKLATNNAGLTRQHEVAGTARAEAEKQIKTLRRELEARTQKKTQFGEIIRGQCLQIVDLKRKLEETAREKERLVKRTQSSSSTPKEIELRRGIEKFKGDNVNLEALKNDLDADVIRLQKLLEAARTKEHRLGDQMQRVEGGLAREVSEHESTKRELSQVRKQLKQLTH